ncbi:putative E3 ubiquitin-protein ligase march1 [Cocos nucifera]|uniref:Putative E3 ubiquitin-protein ligase march1 n=1 Tax=Cocos nucifera TaxID=13894 RepID=A0A8K0I2A4_COCNU|nr:putative E3 ubiquitin-protein ligase march1 [Cocos nucifera]
MTTKVDPGSSSPLIAPAPVPEPGEIDLEAGQGEQLQCRICLETDGRDFIAPCKCKGTSKYVHRECLDHWRAVREYVVEDVDGEGMDWCPPPLPPEHVQQLKSLGLL